MGMITCDINPLYHDMGMITCDINPLHHVDVKLKQKWLTQIKYIGTTKISFIQ